MQFGIIIPLKQYSTPEALRSIAQKTEELGYDSLWVSDHLIVPNAYKSGFGGDRYEFLTAMTYLAALTSRVKLGTSVIIVPYRNPILVARVITTIDHLSEGRVIFGAASGWLREEFEFLGVCLLYTSPSPRD